MSNTTVTKNGDIVVVKSSDLTANNTVVVSQTDTSTVTVTTSGPQGPKGENGTSLDSGSFVTNSQTSSLSVLSASYAATASILNILTGSLSEIYLLPLISSSVQNTSLRAQPLKFISTIQYNAGRLTIPFITSTLTGTASWATNAINAATSSISGIAINALYTNNAAFADDAANAQYTISASYAYTASYLTGKALSASYADMSISAISASYISTLRATGSDTNIQYNNNGNLGASNNFTWNGDYISMVPFNGNTAGFLGFYGINANDFGLFGTGDDYIAGKDDISNYYYANDQYRFIGQSLTHRFIGNINITGSSNITGNTTINGSLTIGSVNEKMSLNESTISPSMSFDFDSSAIFYLRNQTSSTTYNVINVPTASLRAIALTFVIEQGSTGYSGSAYQFNGSNLSVKWANSIIPTGSANKTDVIGLTAFRSGSTWNVLGSLSTFS